MPFQLSLLALAHRAALSKMDKEDFKKRLEEIVGYLKTELLRLRAGRASIEICENITVDAYNTKMPLNQLATLSVPEPRVIVIQPWDKSMLKNIESALRAALKDFNPIVDADTVRLVFPAPSEERRKELVRETGQRVEEAKVKIRHIREDILEALKIAKDDKDISEDEFFRQKEEAQRLVEEYNKRVEDMGERKKTEVLTL
jgi:ribosome recycling factor